MDMSPRTRLCPCPDCAELVDVDARRCPHCNQPLGDGTTTRLGPAALLWASLALTACPTEDIYGTAGTDSNSNPSSPTAPPTTDEPSTGEATDAGTTAPTGTTDPTGTGTG